MALPDVFSRYRTAVNKGLARAVGEDRSMNQSMSLKPRKQSRLVGLYISLFNCATVSFRVTGFVSV